MRIRELQTRVLVPGLVPAQLPVLRVLARQREQLRQPWTVRIQHVGDGPDDVSALRERHEPQLQEQPQNAQQQQWGPQLHGELMLVGRL
jgi:hypothetical protein